MALGAVLSAAIAVSAQTTNAVVARYSLADAKQLAFQNNWDLLAAKSGVDGATAQLMVSKEFPNPGFSHSTAKIGDHEDSTSLGNGVLDRSYDTILAINQLIEIGGKRHDRQTSAKAGILGAKARFFDARRALDQGVTKVYVAALLARENERILNDSAAKLHHETEVAQARLKAGDISESDEKQIENNGAVFELQAKSAAAAAVQARIAVEILMGNPEPKGDWEPLDSLSGMAETVQSGAVSGTNALRPDVLAAEADLRQSRSDLKLQKAMRIPDPTFLVGEEHDPPPGGPPVDTVIVGVSFPLPLWNQNQGEIKAQQSVVDQSVLALEKARAQAVSDLANAQVEYREAFDRWQRYHSEIIPNSAKSRDAVAFAYEKGGATWVDLLEAERADNDARLAEAQARADTASAIADMNAAETMMTEAQVQSAK